MTDHFTIIFEREGHPRTSLIVRNKNRSSTNTDPINYALNLPISIDSTLNILGIEKVPFKELVPKYKQIKNTDELIGQSCSICQCNYIPKEYKRELACKHTFHKKCIDKWLRSSLTCPFCRKCIG